MIASWLEIEMSLTQVAICSMPAFPGRQKISANKGEFLSWRTMACSLPPEPMTKTLFFFTEFN